jgi:hypothetical protein
MSVNEKMTAIADAIRDKTGGTEPLTLDDMAAEIPKVYEEGKKAERDTFWETIQKGGIEMNYNYAFGYNKFTDGNYFPKYDIIIMQGGTTGSYIFYMALELTDIKVSVDARLATNLQRTFHRCELLKRIPKLIIGANTVFTNTFELCYELEELNIEGVIAKNGFNVQWSEKLNKASIESIINALSATESGLTVTFSKTAVNNAFTAEEWDALEATKTNWTISLV